MVNYNIGALDSLMVVSWGPIKTGKTTFALTAPKPLVLLDMDLGAYRALPRFKEYKVAIYQEDSRSNNQLERLAATHDIIIVPFRLPLEFAGRNTSGFLSLWENTIMPLFLQAVESRRIATIVVDTGTLWWHIATRAHLERLQRHNKDRVQLTQMEYSRPHMDMQSLCMAARQGATNLIVPHQLTGIWEKRPTVKGLDDVRVGDTWDGWRRIGAFCDIILRHQIKSVAPNVRPAPSAVIETCGLTLEAEGQLLQPVTFDSLKLFVETLRAKPGI